MQLDRRSFMKLLSVSAVAGPAVLAGGAGEAGITSPAMMGFDVSRSPARASVWLYGQTTGGDWIVLGNPGDVFAIEGIKAVQVRGEYSGREQDLDKFTAQLLWLRKKNTNLMFYGDRGSLT